MGCWHGTCGVSNLPIHHGDKVMTLVIKVPLPRKIENQSGACYANEFAAPVTLAFEAEYDDYGLVENVKENIITEKIKEIFKREGLESLKDILRKIERDEYYVEEGHGEGTAFGLWMCHKHVWDSLTKDPELRSGWREEHPYYHFREAFGEWFDLVKAYKVAEDAYFEDIRKGRPANETPADTIKREPCKSYFDLKHKIEQNPFNDCTGAGYGSGRVAVRKYGEMLKDLIAEGRAKDDADVVALVDAMCELKAMHIAMESLRKIWFPQSGKGSQSSPYGWYKKLWDASERVVKQYDKVLCEENVMDDDHDIYKYWD